MGNIAFAFMLTAIAGLSTGIGSCIDFFFLKQIIKNFYLSH